MYAASTPASAAGHVEWSSQSNPVAREAARTGRSAAVRRSMMREPVLPVAPVMSVSMHRIERHPAWTIHS